MNARDRLRSVYHGRTADRLPWAPIITAETISTYCDDVRKAGPVAFTKAAGGDVLYRGAFYRTGHPKVQVTGNNTEEGTRTTSYSTPLGTITETSCGERIMERQIKSLADYDIFRFIYENQEFSFDEQSYREAEREVGEAGIITASIGPTPVQRLLQFEMGVDAFAYNLADHPQELDELMTRMHAKNLELYEKMADSSAEFIMLYENTSTTMISPAIYERYSLGHVRDFVEVVHARGKVAIVHMCGKINKLLPLIRRTGLDAVDCLTPAPTGDVDFEEAFEILDNRVTIHGLLDPSEWTHQPIETIRHNIQKLLTPKILKRPFVFCTAADGLAGIPAEKFMAIGKIIRKYSLIE